LEDLRSDGLILFKVSKRILKLTWLAWDREKTVTPGFDPLRKPSKRRRGHDLSLSAAASA
jgi:hypothetical protein